MKSRSYVLSHTARGDIVEIFDYIATDDESVAALIVNRILEKIGWVASSGSTGVARQALSVGLRVTHSGPYGIYFTIAEDILVVHRILHDSRNITSGDFAS